MRPTDDPAEGLDLLEALIRALPKLIASGDLTRTVLVERDGEVLRPSMTLGMVLEQLDRLERSASGPETRDRLEASRQALAATAAERPKDYAVHLERELRSQLDGWRWFLEACERGEDACQDDFAAELQRRSRLALLLAEATRVGTDVDALARRLARMDATFQAQTLPGPYAGPAGDSQHFPASNHPWLYRRPR